MPLLRWIKSHSPALILLTILSFLCFKNYTPGTYLIGWDNLMPELNIWLNLKRSFLAVWQEYQGLGLVGGMGHATDLIRQLILLPFILTLPTNLIRYLWHFSMLFLGTLGIYFGLSHHRQFSKWIAFCSALFYLLNFGSIQYFWAPFEPFSTFWGFFPWLFFFLYDYLQQPTRKSLTKLVIINFLAIPAFYVQTIFFVYLICLGLIIFSHFVFHLHSWHAEIKKSLKFILLLFLINSFWLLPFFYFLKTNINQPQLAFGNQMSNQETFDRNQLRGTLDNFSLLRGYYYDFPDSENFFMQPWINYFNQQLPLIGGYLLATFVFFGLIYILAKIRRLNSQTLSLLLLFLLSSIALLSATPPFSQINYLLRQNQLIGQVFRSPFTKFIVPAIFSFSLLSAFGLQIITRSLRQLHYHQSLSGLTYGFFIACLLFFSWPVFDGNYISPKLRIAIPGEYFQLFKFLQSQPDTGRIANLPQGSFWGWTNYRWGVRGSGFLWYALPQPILDRAFDVWNLNNEQYYWEISTAIQSQDPIAVENIIKKYSIKYILFDNSIFFPDEYVYTKNVDRTQKLISQINNLKLVHQFGQISLYQYQDSSPASLISHPSNILYPHFYYTDQAFSDHADYISTPSGNSYPFSNLFSNRFQSEIPYSFSLDSRQITIQSHSAKVSFPIDSSVNVNKQFSQPIPPFQKLITTPNGSYYQLTNQDNQNIFAIDFPQSPLNQSYLLKINYQNLSGPAPTVSANSTNSLHKYFETRLSAGTSDWQDAWFILPAEDQSDFESGITVLINNQSLNSQNTTNLIKSADLFPIPLSRLLQTQTIANNNTSIKTDISSSSNIFFYQTKINSLNSSDYLTLYQSFSPGWLAFYFDGFKPVFLTNHVLINNWANGWQLDTTYHIPHTIYILFWPQLLEFLGFGLLIGSFIYIFRDSR